MGTSEMNLFLVIRRASDRHFYSGSTANGSPAFAPSFANAKVFFLKDHKDISKYQEFATRLGVSVMMFSYQPYSNAEQESNRLVSLSLNDKKVLATAGWYPNGSPSFQHPHMVCARCGAKVVGNRGNPAIYMPTLWLAILKI